MKDFRVFVDGKPLAMDEFEVVTESMPASSEISGTRAEGPNVFRNIEPITANQTEIVILLVDYLNTRVTDRMELRKSLLKFFSTELEPNQQLAVYGLTYYLKLLHPFTQDNSSLAKVAEKLMKEKGQPPDPKQSRPLEAPAVLDRPPSGQGTDAVIDYFQLKNARREYNIDQTMRLADTLAAFRELAESFAGLSGKKTVVWLTGDASPLNPTLLYHNIADKSIETPGAPWQEIAKTYEALNAAGMSIFPVDVRGVGNSGLVEAQDELTNPEFNMMVRGSQAVDDIPYNQLTDFRQGEAANAVQGMQNVAAETGGKALNGRNDTEKLLERAESLWANYYVLAFAPESASGGKPVYHRIEVKVDRPGVQVLARRGYVAWPQALISSWPEIQRDLAEASLSPVDLASVPLQLTLERSSIREGRLHFLYRVTIASNVLSPSKDHMRYDISVASLVRDEGGKALDSVAQRLRGTVPLASVTDASVNGLAYRGEFSAPAKQVVFGRVIVRDNLTGRIGTITVPLTKN